MFFILVSTTISSNNNNMYFVMVDKLFLKRYLYPYLILLCALRIYYKLFEKRFTFYLESEVQTVYVAELIIYR